MSDTHGKHNEIFVPQGDVLVHAGDFTKTGELGTIQDLSRFFRDLDFDSIICIAGNHELTFQPEHYDRVWTQFHRRRFDTDASRKSLKNCTYLQDESCKIGGGIEVYGSPWQPGYCDWAFNLERGQPLRDVWTQIPASTDILITHGPPLGRGDQCCHGERVGCYDLLKAVQERVKPRLHVFGHIHEGFGVSSDATTLFVNASNLTSRYAATNPCTVVDMPHDRSQRAILVKPECKILNKMDFATWLKNNNFDNIATRLETISEDRLPIGNQLLTRDAFASINEHLSPQRETRVTEELRRALKKLYADSFEYTPRKPV